MLSRLAALALAVLSSAGLAAQSLSPGRNFVALDASGRKIGDIVGGVDTYPTGPAVAVAYTEAGTERADVLLLPLYPAMYPTSPGPDQPLTYRWLRRVLLWTSTDCSGQAHAFALEEVGPPVGRRHAVVRPGPLPNVGNHLYVSARDPILRYLQIRSFYYTDENTCATSAGTQFYWVVPVDYALDLDSLHPPPITLR